MLVSFVTDITRVVVLSLNCDPFGARTNCLQGFPKTIRKHRIFTNSSDITVMK